MLKKAAFVGLTNIDYVYYLDSLPEENSKCKTGDYSKYIGGPAANAAITYAALGGDATLITAIGGSAEGRIIEEGLSAYGVKVINTAHDDRLPGMSTICISKNGDRTIISGQNSYEDIHLDGIDMDAYDFAMFDCNQQDIALPLLEGTKCDIVLDAGSYKENTDRFLEKAKIVISSEQFRDPKGMDIFEMEYPNIRYKAMTRGEKPIRLTDGELAVPQVKCVDSLAAGDIFHGAFCFAFYEKGMQFDEALTYAAKIASKSVQHKGPRLGEENGQRK